MNAELAADDFTHVVVAHLEQIIPCGLARSGARHHRNLLASAAEGHRRPLGPMGEAGPEIVCRAGERWRTPGAAEFA